ncbi:hypothetical protein Q1695_015811 [Nippostrongylus brasiliensis]|nr:hypothetical protein Q1695_015811 [Nippostrongylus brasiliensis]
MVGIAIVLLLVASCTASKNVRIKYKEQVDKIFRKQRSECAKLDARNQILIPEFLDAHEGMNLTLSCGAMRIALNAVQLLKARKPSYVGHPWCQYTRFTYDPWDYIALVRDPAFYHMPMDKIRQTAKLHSGTIYGCAVRVYESFVGSHYTTVCIYQRKAGEHRCFCN